MLLAPCIFPLSPTPTPSLPLATDSGVAPTAYVPSGGLLAHYAAEDLAAGAVSSWADQSGSGNHLSATGADGPVLDSGGAFPVVRCDGTEADWLTTTGALFSGGQERSVVLVYQSDDAAALYDICGQGDNGTGGGWGFYVYNESGQDPSVTTGGPATHSGAVFSSAYKWAIASYRGGRMEVIDAGGTATGTLQSISDAGVPFTVGQVPGSYHTNPFKGSVAELLVYGHALTAEEQTALVDYLTAKFSL